jgi:hypothetical protein
MAMPPHGRCAAGPREIARKMKSETKAVDPLAKPPGLAETAAKQRMDWGRPSGLGHRAKLEGVIGQPASSRREGGASSKVRAPFAPGFIWISRFSGGCACHHDWLSRQTPSHSQLSIGLGHAGPGPQLDSWGQTWCATLPAVLQLERLGLRRWQLSERLPSPDRPSGQGWRLLSQSPLVTSSGTRNLKGMTRCDGHCQA